MDRLQRQAQTHPRRQTERTGEAVQELQERPQLKDSNLLSNLCSLLCIAGNRRIVASGSHQVRGRNVEEENQNISLQLDEVVELPDDFGDKAQCTRGFSGRSLDPWREAGPKVPEEPCRRLKCPNCKGTGTLLEPVEEALRVLEEVIKNETLSIAEINERRRRPMDRRIDDILLAEFAGHRRVLMLARKIDNILKGRGGLER